MVFCVLPIAHQYEFHMILQWCEAAAQEAEMTLWPPSSSQPVASDAVPHQPDLVQLLALADQRQCEKLVGNCVTQLISSNGDDVMRQALVSRHLGPMVDGLRSETKSEIIWRMAGLPQSLKVSFNESTSYFPFINASVNGMLIFRGGSRTLGGCYLCLQRSFPSRKMIIPSSAWLAADL